MKHAPSNHVTAISTTGSTSQPDRRATEPPRSLPTSPVTECICGGVPVMRPPTNLYATFSTNQTAPIWPTSNVGMQNYGMVFMGTTAPHQSSGYATTSQSEYGGWNTFDMSSYSVTSPMVLQQTPDAEAAEDYSDTLGFHSLDESF
ncbi:hypothetical protein BP6252_01642 [Coleophoma cylindrospora]|uniref:Uncharacterized protein n=1 Tax=Coleophoma cylindrospora TaxID=1849047 RepID=A0A3D8STH2_9HELO|nr:hypothetical protein BP6252_01642 [Coleophoma cylindrospora]